MNRKLITTSANDLAVSGLLSTVLIFSAVALGGDMLNDGPIGNVDPVQHCSFARISSPPAVLLIDEDNTDAAASLLDNSVLVDKMIKHIKSLQDDWDGEGAPAPNEAAIDLATHVLEATTSMNMMPMEVDADVLGGIAIWFCQYPLNIEAPQRLVWISCMNTGSGAIIYKGRENEVQQRSEKLDINILSNVHKFLHEDSDNGEKKS